MWKILLVFVIGICLVSARDEGLPNTLPRSLDSKNFQNLTQILKPSIISSKEFLLYEKGLQNVKNKLCRKDLNATLWGIVEGLPWAVAMYDSSVKVPAGVQSGSVYQFGNFDECVNSADGADQSLPPRVLPKYCLADVTVEGLSLTSLLTRKPQPPNSTVVYWGVCLPSSCLPEDVESFMSSILDLEVHVDDNKCHVNKPFEASRAMVIYGCVILCFIMMTLFSTSYHMYMIFRKKSLKERPSESFEMVMKSFSVIENMKKLFQKSHDHL